MAQVEVTANSLIVNVVGWDKLWALRSQLEIPLAHLVNAEIAGDAAVERWKGWRIGGTSVPGVITAGNFYKDGEWTFWDVHNPEQAIVIHLVGERYARLMIEVENPEETVEAIRRARNTRAAGEATG